MTVIAFPRVERRATRLRAIEHCLAALSAEADEMGDAMLAHLIAVAREAAHEAAEAEPSR